MQGIDREQGLAVITPSGLDYDGMKQDDTVNVDFRGRIQSKADGSHLLTRLNTLNCVDSIRTSPELSTLTL